MRFIHAADLHLGLRVTGLGKETNRRVQEARFQALDNLVAEAKKHAVDFILIAGDLFDDNHVDAIVRGRPLELFRKLPMPVYVLPGNHDPLRPDSVWERPPWNQLSDANVHVLRQREPVSPMNGVTLYPCPLTSTTSPDDPTEWLPPRAAGENGIRIGVAHGSVNDRERLSEDDHLIDRNVAERCGLDYLALGHWHHTLIYPDSQGVERMAYSGVHEPKGFPHSTDPRRNLFVGWMPYSNAKNPELFAGDGRGKVLLVGIPHAGAAPAIKEIATGYLEWKDETVRVLHEEDLSKLINDLATRPNYERQLLRLTLQGTLNAKAYLRVDELEGSPGAGGVLRRYYWFDLNKDGLGVEPTEDELRELVGDGVLSEVYRLLCPKDAPDDPAGRDAGDRELADQALLVLYRLAQECGR